MRRAFSGMWQCHWAVVRDEMPWWHLIQPFSKMPWTGVEFGRGLRVVAAIFREWQKEGFKHLIKTLALPLGGGIGIGMLCGRQGVGEGSGLMRLIPLQDRGAAGKQGDEAVTASSCLWFSFSHVTKWLPASLHSYKCPKNEIEKVFIII